MHQQPPPALLKGVHAQREGALHTRLPVFSPGRMNLGPAFGSEPHNDTRTGWMSSRCACFSLPIPSPNSLFGGRGLRCRRMRTLGGTATRSTEVGLLHIYPRWSNGEQYHPGRTTGEEEPWQGKAGAILDVPLQC